MVQHGLNRPFFKRLCKRCEELYVPESTYSEICQKCNLKSKKKRIANYKKDQAQGKHKKRAEALQKLAASTILIFQPPRHPRKLNSYSRVCRDCEEVYTTQTKGSKICDSCKHDNFVKAQRKVKQTWKHKTIKNPLAFRKYGEYLSAKATKRRATQE